MKVLSINNEECSACGICIAECPVKLFSLDSTKAVSHSDPNELCIGCGHCAAACPQNAVACDVSKRTQAIADTKISFSDAARLLNGKRSIRQYKNMDIPEEEIEKVLEVMRYAPSGHNEQPCEYIILKNRDLIKMISDITIKSFKSFRNLIRMRRLLKLFVSKEFYDILNDKGTEIGIQDMTNRYESGEDVIFFDAPVVIIVHVPDMGGFSYVDSAIAVTHGMLAAHALGIGSCWMGFAMMAAAKNKKLFETFQIAKGRLIAGIFTLGYPKNKFYRLPVRNSIQVSWCPGAMQ